MATTPNESFNLKRSRFRFNEHSLHAVKLVHSFLGAATDTRFHIVADYFIDDPPRFYSGSPSSMSPTK
jgi:hypothetical protein